MNDEYSTIWDVFQTPNNTNSSNFEDSPQDIEKAGLSPEIAHLGHIAYGIIAPLIISFGIITNILNLIILSRPSLRGPTYRYLMWLAVSNLLVCIVLLPFILHSHETPVQYHYAFYLAHIEMPLGNALIASSVFIVVGLTIDRYVAICHPRKYRNLHSPQVASVRVGISFFIGFLIYIPMFVGKTVISANDPSKGYLPKDNLLITRTKWWLAYKFLLEMCARFAPAIILALLNICIIKEFKKISKRRRFLSSSCGNSGFPSQSNPEISDGFMSIPPEEKLPAQNPQEHKAEFNEWKETSFYRINENREIVTQDSLKTITPQANCLYINTTPPNSDQCVELQLSSGHSDKTSGDSQTFQQNPLVADDTSKNHLNPKLCPCENNEGPLLVISKIHIKEDSIKKTYPRRAMSERRLDMERRLILLLVSIIVAFFLTNIPSAFLSLTFNDEKRDSVQYQIFRAIANNLEFLNFGLHFVLYFLFSQDIRKVFISIVKRSCRKVWKKLITSTVSKTPKY